MATTITAPAAYSPVKKSVVFGINRTGVDVVNVLVNGHLKQLPNGSRSINVAPYFKGEFYTTPNLDHLAGATLQVFDGIEWGRIVNAAIVVDGVQSTAIPLLYADQTAAQNHFMTDLRRRTIAKGQIDEIAVFAQGTVFVRFGTETLLVEAGVTFIRFKAPENAQARFSIQITNTIDKELDRIDYELGNDSDTRIAWVNTYGAVDYNNFSTCQKSASKITKTRIYSENGYVTTAANAEQTNTIVTRPLPASDLEAISYLLLSDQVWRISDTPTPIDITTDTATTFDINKLSTIQINYRNKIKQL